MSTDDRDPVGAVVSVRTYHALKVECDALRKERDALKAQLHMMRAYDTWPKPERTGDWEGDGNAV